MGKWCLHANLFIFDRIIIKVPGNQDRHKIWVEYDFGPNQTTHFGVTCPWVTKMGKWCSMLPHSFLAHLSRRLTRWAYSISMVRRPSVVVRRRPSSVVVVVHTFKLEYLWSHLANLDQILSVASLGWGKGFLRFWGRLDQNSGFHGNRKLPLAYNGESDVSTFSRLFLIRSFLYSQVPRTCIKSRTSSNFG